MTLSIDIGRVNLGYAYLNGMDLDFGVYSLDDKNQQTRIKSLYSFLSSFNCVIVIVERQVSQNVIAMQLMSGVLMYCEAKDIEVIIFNPKDKFIQGEKWKGKGHKKLSIAYANTYLNKCGSSLDAFTKKDDIADAILMLLKCCYSQSEYIAFIS